MKRIIFFVFVLRYVTISNSRLIEKIPEAKTTAVSETSTLQIRTKRLFINDAAAFQSKEEPFENAFEKKSKSLLNNNRLLKDTSRIPRQSNETNTEENKPADTEKTVLVKKPIPKFNDLDEYYIEPKHFKLARFVESDENEDEDFNLDDYDFDVKHDEYVGRGKPSVPRKEDNATSETTTEVLKVAQVIDAVSDSVSKVAKQRSLHRIEDKKQKEKDEFYDYDGTTTQKVETKDTEESTEIDRPTIRSKRSYSLKHTAFYNKVSKAAVKRPVMLPMFPVQNEPATERDSRKDIM
nr:uncharacterized protein LOC128678372 [Plodia interpunctella]